MNEADQQPEDIVAEFQELHRSIIRATYGTILLCDCESQFTKLLEFIRAHPENRPQFVNCFQPNLSDYITRFCMRHLQWPEIADSARNRMQEDIHNSEYESLRKLLDVYESIPENRNV